MVLTLRGKYELGDYKKLGRQKKPAAERTVQSTDCVECLSRKQIKRWIKPQTSVSTKSWQWENPLRIITRRAWQTKDKQT